MEEEAPLTPQSYHTSPKRYTRQQAKIGGIRSGATRRFNSRHRHAEIRRLHAEGLTQAAIASAVGYSQSTVSKILRGAIKTCLTLAESTPITAKRAAEVGKRKIKRMLRLAGYSRSNPPSPLTPSAAEDGMCQWCIPCYRDRAEICPGCGRRLDPMPVIALDGQPLGEILFPCDPLLAFGVVMGGGKLVYLASGKEITL